MHDEDTIVAPATSSGEGGIGIIRLSGPRSEEFLDLHFNPAYRDATRQSHRLYYGQFYDRQQQPIDEVMTVVMRKPYSYTREDVVEVHAHGGRLVMRNILDAFIEDGARLAKPGEFTLRAFLNGRIDLSKAEAVIDLIRARSDLAGRLALNQLQGSVSRIVHELQNRLSDLLAQVEVFIDFPEEDLEFIESQQLQNAGSEILSRIDRFLAEFDYARLIREGMSVLILGRPNVGKSSLLNLLLGEARAIVTDIAGTTRDTIEESLVLGGIPLRLIDTAGICQTNDPIETQGIARAVDKIQSADLVLLVLDSSLPVNSDDLFALDLCQQANILLVLNKSDLLSVPLAPNFQHLPKTRLSSHTGTGIDDLKSAIIAYFRGTCAGGDISADLIFSDRRHRESLLRCREALHRFLQAVADGAFPEFLSLELREASHALGEITGETTPDDVLDRIFSRFCIGK